MADIGRRAGDSIAAGFVNVADVRPLTSSPELTARFESAPLYGPDGSLIRGPQR